MLRSRLASAFLCSCVVACGGGGGGDDDDGPAVCGDGDRSGDEECDDGNTDPGDGCDQNCASEVPPTAFRATEVFIRDPHFFAIGLDVTDVVNTDLMDAITMDTDDPADGLLNLSLLFVFRPVDPAAEESRADAVLGADCTAPMAGTTCTLGEETTVVETVAHNGDGTCMEPLAGTTGNEAQGGDYDPSIDSPSGPCFATDAEPITLTAGGIALSLLDARVAGTYSGSGPDTIMTGLMMGFMTQEAADNTTLPEDTPIVNGDPLSSVLKDEDKDEGPNGEEGWWFYFNFTAEVVTFNEE